MYTFQNTFIIGISAFFQARLEVLNDSEVSKGTAKFVLEIVMLWPGHTELDSQVCPECPAVKWSRRHAGALLPASPWPSTKCPHRALHLPSTPRLLEGCVTGRAVLRTDRIKITPTLLALLFTTCSHIYEGLLPQRCISRKLWLTRR